MSSSSNRVLRHAVAAICVALSASPQAAELTRDTGAPVGDNENSQTAGPAGPVLLQDSALIEKLQRFDRERTSKRRAIEQLQTILKRWEELQPSEHSLSEVVINTRAESELELRFIEKLREGKGKPSGVTVTLRDAAGTPVIGKTVSLSSSRGAADTITPGTATTGVTGGKSDRAVSGTFSSGSWEGMGNDMVASRSGQRRSADGDGRQAGSCTGHARGGLRHRGLALSLGNLLPGLEQGGQDPAHIHPGLRIPVQLAQQNLSVRPIVELGQILCDVATVFAIQTRLQTHTGQLQGFADEHLGGLTCLHGCFGIFQVLKNALVNHDHQFDRARGSHAGFELVVVVGLVRALGHGKLVVSSTWKNCSAHPVRL